jgi:cation:H+ antiporter
MIGLLIALLLSLPWIALNAIHFHGDPLIVAILTGVAILGAAFLLSWSAEVFQMDVSQALALTLLALIAILPEYAVDAVFAYEAGRDPEVAKLGYAVANMTGSNRLLVGLGWSSIILFAWLRYRAREVALEPSSAVEMSILLLASLYALTIPWKGELGLIDTLVLVPLFGLYALLASRAPAEEPDLAGPAATIGGLRTAPRRAAVLAMFAFAAYVIFIAAEPFAHALVDTGLGLGVDEFLLVQWLAPLASEAPEFIVALLFVARRQAAAGIRTLVSSLVNQWTLLVATLPVVFSIGAGQLSNMSLVSRQGTEIWLTAAQSFYAIVLISDFRLSRREGLALFIPFFLQVVLPAELRNYFTIGYAFAGASLLVQAKRRNAIAQWPSYIRASLKSRPAHTLAVPTTRLGESAAEQESARH